MCAAAAGFAAVVVVVGVDGAPWVVTPAAALWVEVDEEDPQAAATSVSSTAAIDRCRHLIGFSQPPGSEWLVFKDAAGAALLPAADKLHIPLVAQRSGAGRTARSAGRTASAGGNECQRGGKDCPEAGVYPSMGAA